MGEPLSAVDAAWLHMEEPGNLMNVNGVFLFDGPLRWEEMRARLAERLLAFEPFRCRVVERPFRRPCWELDPEFDLARHVIRLEHSGNLMDLVGELLSRPLDRAHPLWQMHCVETGDGWALVGRLHHAIGDGVALMHVLGHLTDRAPETYRATHQENHRDLACWARSAADLVSEVVLKKEPRTALKGILGTAKRAAVSAPLDMERLRAAKSALGCTINDLLLEAVTASLGQYLAQPPEAIRVVMPVDLRGARDEKLGNRFGLTFVRLPVGMREPGARLQALRAGLGRLKRSVQPLLIYAILHVAGVLPGKMESWLVRFFGSRATAVVTNVPGPREVVTILGQPLRDLMFWVPQSGRLALGISLISYAGTVRVGVACDAAIIPDPERIVAGFEQALVARVGTP